MQERVNFLAKTPKHDKKEQILNGLPMKMNIFDVCKSVINWQR
jgi:hypothetical protein